jgi:uncharacterized SAM-binding protein YcdF (DUF218 family)
MSERFHYRGYDVVPKRQWSKWCVGIYPTRATLFAALCCLLPDRMNRLLVAVLEQRFRRTDITSPESLTGIIVLGGDCKRFFEAGRLARQHPNLSVVVSCGKSVSSALAELGGGIEPSRIVLETRSENTYQNAIYSTKLVKPRPGERWLLVTGAMHMTRAIGSFRGAGFEVEPWPVYHRTSPEPSMATEAPAALHEWVGLIVYRLLGRTRELFPAPAN